MKNNSNAGTNERTTGFLKNVVLVLIAALLVKTILGVEGVASVMEKVKSAQLQTTDTDTMNVVSTEETGELVKTEKILTEKTVQEVTKRAEKMVTQEVQYEKVGHYSKSKKILGKNVPLTKDDILFTYEATVYIGVDLAKAEYEVDNENKVITITLPGAEIIAHEINEDSFAYHTIKDSIFTSSSMDEYVDEITKLKNLKEEELIEDGKVFDSTTVEAESMLIKLLCMSDETNTYTIRFEK